MSADGPDDSSGNLESMFDTLHCGSHVSPAQVDELATMIQTKLGVDMDQSAYREMAKTFLKFKVSNSSSTNQKQDQPSSPDKPSVQAPLDEQPTWSLSSESSSPDSIGKTRPSQSSSPRRQPNSRNDSMRGRSPARKRDGGGPKIPKSGRSRTPTNPLRRKNGADQKARSPSRSPFRLFRRVSSKNQLANDEVMPKEDSFSCSAPSPSVYYDTNMEFGSPNPVAPTNDNRRPNADFSAGISPPFVQPKPNPSAAQDGRQASTSFGNPDLSANTGSVNFDQDAATKPHFGADPTINLAAAETTAAPFNVESMDDVTFNVGTSSSSPRKTSSPTKRSSPRHKKSPRYRPPRTTADPQPTPAPTMATTPMTDATGNPNNPSFLFSPPQQSPGINQTMDFSISKTPGAEDMESSILKSAAKSRSNPRFFGQNSGSRDKARDRSKSPLRNLFTKVFQSSAPFAHTPKVDTSAFPSESTAMPTPSPIPHFQAPEQMFADRSSQGSLPTPKSMNLNMETLHEDSVEQKLKSSRNTATPAPSVAMKFGQSATSSQANGDEVDQSSANPKVFVAGSTPFHPGVGSAKISTNRKSRSKRHNLQFRRVDFSQSSTTSLGSEGPTETEKSSPTKKDNSEAATQRNTAATFGYPADAVPSKPVVETTPAFGVAESPGTRNPSPMSVDMSTQQQTPTVRFGESIDDDLSSAFQFSLGAETKPKTNSILRNRATQGTRTKTPRKAYFMKTTPATATTFTKPPTETANVPRPQPVHAMSNQTRQRATSDTCPVQTAEVDYTGMKAFVQSLKEEARNLYLAGNYHAAILRNTAAINSYKSNPSNTDRDVLAVLLSNRAAGLLMVGASAAAAEDCDEALKYVSSTHVGAFSYDSGPVLEAKISNRMAKALLKIGEADRAVRTFERATRATHRSREISNRINDAATIEATQKIFDQILTEAHLGRSEASKLSTTMRRISDPDATQPSGTPATRRRKTQQKLKDVKNALDIAPNCDWLHEIKVSLLAELRRWREVASHCERLAAANAKQSGVFTQDLEHKNPFPGIPDLRSLTVHFFGNTTDDELPGAELKLNSKAVAEAVLRMPHQLIATYARALRLEERYPAAEALIATLQSVLRDRVGARAEFAWLNREHDKLTRTKMSRENGDNLFRAGKFDEAASRYDECLKIDREGDPSIDGSSTGGRLHAVLFCNRAACLMAERRFHEAVTECTAALRIHVRYMKAMLRRARCYTRLDRPEEAQAEYKKWLELANEARQGPSGVNVMLTPCLFDGPNDVSDADIKQVKRELEEVVLTKAKRDAKARADASYRQQKYDFAQKASSNQGEAHRRRENFYNQGKGSSRRWDSFADRGPKRSTKPRQEQQKSSPKPKPPTKSANDHYSTLQISTGATETEIKKAYRKLALKYHPDKNSDPSAVDIFRRVSQAYDTLKDQTSRRRYDTERRFQRRF